MISQGRDVGSADTYSRELDGRTLTFGFDGESFADEQTGSEWTVLGRAVRGVPAGKQLAPVVNVNHWAGLCPTCHLELSLLQKAYATYGGQVVFLGVDIGLFTGLDFEREGRPPLERDVLDRLWRVSTWSTIGFSSPDSRPE